MADPLVSALAQTIIETLSSRLLQEIGLLCGLKDELKKLQGTFTTLRSVLHDAEMKQRKNEQIQNWLRKLKDAAYDVENVLDEMATEVLRRRVESERGKCFLSFRIPLKFQFKMAHQVKNVRRKLDLIAKDRHNFHLEEGVPQNPVGATPGSRQTTSLVTKEKICGRQEEQDMIMEILLNSTLQRDDLFVYAVYGMGGLGKTTLAKLIYNDERAKKHFEVRIWVCVSVDFNVQRLLRKIIESIDDRACDFSELDPLQRRLRDRLSGTRFLLVLDDVWNENPRLWDELKEILRCDSKGSAVVVTTREEKIASLMAATNVYGIGCLTDADSWSLFEQKAFSTREVEDNFREIGEGIVKKCRGVPLAIKALGSLMRFKSDESEWLAIKESEIWQLSDDENGILAALRLSYYNLSPQMRQCFAYCCLFPKDYEMEVDELIQLWVANGFVVGQTDLPLAGRSIFKELVRRSFFQDVQINYRGRRTCKMHDLMHDLAVSVMRHEATSILEHGKVQEIPETLRHLSLGKGSLKAVVDNKSKFKDVSLRSLMAPGRYADDFTSILSNQRYLRVLHSKPLFIKDFSNLVWKFKHLRYLCMSCGWIKRLPASLTRLCNLQTLRLLNSELLVELPKDLRVMKNLLFLEIETHHSLISTPPGLGDLTRLRGLSIFIVGQEASQQIEQLEELNLGGELSIRGLENVRNLADARRAKLMTKVDLTYLSLEWKEHVNNNSAEHHEEVLQGLQPYRNLEKIRIMQYQGSKFPNWMTTLDFMNLREVELRNCERIEHLPPIGKLPSLTRVVLQRMDSVKRLGAEWHGHGECSFLELTDLIIEDMPNLEEWSLPDSVKSFPRLNHLQIERCPKLTGLPILPNHNGLKRLWISALPVRTLSEVLDNVSALEELWISCFSDLENLPESMQQLSALRVLNIGYCDGLSSLPDWLGKLPSLTRLDLSRMDSVKRLGAEWHGHGGYSFPALTYLLITDMPNLEEWSLPDSVKSFPRLTDLVIHQCPKLTRLPILRNHNSLKRLWLTELPVRTLSQVLDNASALVFLSINGFSDLENLPESMQKLSALRRLNIRNCDGLSSLPDWLGSLHSLSRFDIWGSRNLNSLPDAFRNLESLRTLDIDGGPQLEKRCEKPVGGDWPKISHIPDIRINGKTIQRLD